MVANHNLKAYVQFAGAGDVWIEGEVAFARAVLAKWGAAPTPADSVQAPTGGGTSKNFLQVQAWVIPDGNGGGQFSWQKQDERFWARLTTPAQAADSVQRETLSNLKHLSDTIPELNMSNYGPDEVDALNAWAVEMSQAIDAALAANGGNK